MSEPGYSIAAVMSHLSAPRIAPYLERSEGDAERALELYEWSNRMSTTAFATVAHLEVLLRNAIDTALADHSDESSRGIPWFLSQPVATEQVSAAIATVRDRLIPQRRDTRHQIVAGLSFGFWAGMVGPKYEDLWRATLHRAFPGSSGARKQVAAEVEAVRKFRNRLAHHDSVLNVDIPFEMRRVRRVAGFLGADAAAWLNSIDRTALVYAERPRSPIDTVVVPHVTHGRSMRRISLTCVKRAAGFSRSSDSPSMRIRRSNRTCLGFFTGATTCHGQTRKLRRSLSPRIDSIERSLQ